MLLLPKLSPIPLAIVQALPCLCLIKRFFFNILCVQEIRGIAAVFLALLESWENAWSSSVIAKGQFPGNLSGGKTGYLHGGG